MNTRHEATPPSQAPPDRSSSRGPARIGNAWASLRVRLAVLGFLAIYLPALLLFGVILATETDTDVRVENGVETRSTSSDRSASVTWTVVALGPVAAGLAWWWAGRAVRPIERIRAVAEEIEETDLSRRIGLERGPTEVVALAAGFDAMLDRLEHAAETQRHLIEETSHEIRVPLSVLTTNAEVLLAHPDPSVDVYREGLERSRRTAERLRATVDELLVDARGRARTLDRQPADLVTIVRGVVDDAAVLATAREIDVRVAGPARLVCPVDVATVRRAVSNLIDNAIRHSPGGSTVHVDVESTGDQATVVVTDHGPGVPAEEQERIFQRRWRGHNAEHGAAAGDGMGLGLPIARQIALAHGGNLTVASPGPDGDGSVFRLSLRR
ncbi:HAMP domain-containing sensor histidine kinase [Phytoactinopolyspora halotolerans]|uniref:histidine kinase n=1 Tax=Phytoactinopolyspora halotolerans TaxID=1981512 RepID=A0A6L9S4B4_9ACTN|nr:HAMP domain-containing sensor histidine kinase [Phytoactinopolyspora halotolerans]NED99918.1 HAMP domain-containing histidine kinase [Phytoactinopolyspora halotolerans]